MLQQMSPPANAQVGEVTTIARQFEARLCGDVSSSASSDATEDFDLPQCKIKRNYNCTQCTFYTQNPRAHLLHIRDVHFKWFKIHDCPHCVYASRHYQKLVRHIKMVHAVHSNSPAKVEQPVASPAVENIEPIEQMENMVEEVDDSQIIDEDMNDEGLERSDIVGDDSISALDDQSLASSQNKNKYFRCTKCNYVTHIRSRFTKHVKYHSMPMIKCTVCEFRTPYKWNLDRHMRNHGGTGSFHCSMCNFTADIKQSLTVHEMNHHLPPEGQLGIARRRNRVGASDMPLTDDDVVVKEDEGSGDSRSSQSTPDMGLPDADIEMITCNSESNDAIDTEDVLKCDDSQLSVDSQSQHSPNIASDDSRSQKQKKAPRPIPQLIPLNVSTPGQNKPSITEPPPKKMKINNGHIASPLFNLNSSNISKECTISRKKNESFFDRLKERLLTETGKEGSLICKNCGFESKCLSEHSVHEKNCLPQSNRIVSTSSSTNLSSTRCQNCRHRCKSSADLYLHLQTCKKDEKVNNYAENENGSQKDSEVTGDREGPHPMENVVFVWNNINQENNKFDTPLGININDDSTQPEASKSYDSEIVDDGDGMNLSPSNAVGKKVFKCPHCAFWASTASRFHVHIVGHLNKKPFECSLCKYKSNWRWDITKHIKLKSARDPEHNEAKVLMTDETGRRNYSKYNKFLAVSITNEDGENEFHYVDTNASVDSMMEVDGTLNEGNESYNASFETQPLNLQTQHNEISGDSKMDDTKKQKKTLWKCKKCNYRDSSKEALLEHVREHSNAENCSGDMKDTKNDNTPDPSDLAYRCGHCNQLSNWKHVIQRHCRLKHCGVIKVITTVKPKQDTFTPQDVNPNACTKCPFKADDKKLLKIHTQQHIPSSESVFKCYLCDFFVKSETELMQHLTLHGTDLDEYFSTNAKDSNSQLLEQGPSSFLNSSPTKRHKCAECPYETNSKSQYLYHEQFHRLSTETPYKCPECNYSVSKRHLLHQHLRVHGIIPKKSEIDPETDALCDLNNFDFKFENIPEMLDEIQYVWVSAKNEFHKMYKCRYCSYVNSQECKIPNHEKIHCITFENSDAKIYKCLECKFTCDSAVRLAEHSKTHGEIYGRIYCPVETDIPDEEQIAKLRKVVEIEKATAAENTPKEEYSVRDGEAIKIIYFCQKCPARFFNDGELKFHDKFHDLSLAYKCKSCQYSAAQEGELIAHALVHSDEYHTKTKMLKYMHNVLPAHKAPHLELIHCPATSNITWVVKTPGKNHASVKSTNKKSETKHVPKQYYCKECPAKFFKSSALSYHMGLHNGVGDHKCKKCSYTVKNIGNLAKHEFLHERENNPPPCDYDSGEDVDFKHIPLSGTDLFQRKTEAQKRVLTDKDKLVKPNDHFPPVLQADPQFGYLMHGNPEFIYPTYLKNGRQKEKRYKCHKCPSAFEKREQYKIHLSLHGSKQRYKCELCDYSVKYYANYVQHMRKHQMNDEAQAERKKGSSDFIESETNGNNQECTDNIKLAIKTMPRGTLKSDFQQFSVSDQQTLRLLQRRRSLNSSGNDPTATEPSPTKDRKLHVCLLCPYTNQRLDALNNHYRRHDDTDFLNTGSHKCSYCDFVVVQSHFLREHLKTHFNYQKNHNAECFVANEDVSFVITNVDDENVNTDLKLDVPLSNYKCDGEKSFVNMKTGELLVE